VRLRFDDAALEDLPPGFERTFLVVADGFGKDMDLSSAFSDTVEPLPFHGMKSYPYPSDVTYPDDPEARRHREEYNTRRVRP
jgi:hypothetical protein